LAHFFIENEVTTHFDGNAVLDIDQIEEVEMTAMASSNRSPSDCKKMATPSR